MVTIIQGVRKTFIGTSAETKPTTGLDVGDVWREIDTGKVFFWDDSTWKELKTTDLPASYIIFKKDGVVYARNCETNQIDFSGSDASAVIQSVINALTDGGMIFIKKGVSPLRSTISINKSVAIIFEHSDTPFHCEANPTFLITAGNVKIQYGYFFSSIAGTTIFKVVGGFVTVEFANQRFLGSYVINRDILPYHFIVTDNHIDVKVSNVFAYTKRLFKIEKDPEKVAIRMSFEISNIVWRNDFTDGVMIELIADTYGLYNVLANNLYAYNTGKAIYIHTINNGHASFLNFANCQFETSLGATAIHIHAESGWISDIAFSNVVLIIKNDNTCGLKAESAPGGQVHSIHASNLRIQFGSGSNVTGIYIAASGTSYVDGKYFIFEGLRLYDVKTGQISIYTNSNVTHSIFSGGTLYLEFASFGNLGRVLIISPWTINSGSATIPAGSTYVDVVHNLQITPDINKIKVTPKDNLNGRSFWISNVTSTTFRINISSADTVNHVFGWSYG